MNINNYFLISFLLTIIIHLLNFQTHQINSIPIFFNYNYEVGICKLSFINGSLYYCDTHLHHWVLGIFLLYLTFIFKLDSPIKNIIQGFAVATILDGLLFSDRFKF